MAAEAIAKYNHFKAISYQESGKIKDYSPMGNVFEKRNNMEHHNPKTPFLIAEAVREQVITTLNVD